MGFFGKMMAAVGIGAARLDTRLSQAEVRAGDPLQGVISVTGGRAGQRIERLNLELNVRYRSEDDFATFSLFSLPVVGGFDLQAGEEREFPFSLPIPHGVPLSLPGTELWLATDADIAGGMDPGDTDPLRILPDDRRATFLHAMQGLGFGLRGSEVEYRYGQLAQEISFAPPYGHGHLSEVEAVLTPQPHGLEVILEVDRRAKGFEHLIASEFERKSGWTITDAELAQGPQALAHQLARRIGQLT